MRTQNESTRWQFWMGRQTGVGRAFAAGGKWGLTLGKELRWRPRASIPAGGVRSTGEQMVSSCPSKCEQSCTSGCPAPGTDHPFAFLVLVLTVTILIGFLLFPPIHSHPKPIGSQPCLGDWATILDFIIDLGVGGVSFNYLGLSVPM